MRKKAILSIAALLLLLLLTCSCSDSSKPSETTPAPDPASCEHSYGDWQTLLPANCQRIGRRSRTCTKCAYTEEESIPKTDVHTEEIVPALAPTCAKAGYTESLRCAVCHLMMTRPTPIPATGEHLPVIDAAVPSTCKATGLSEGSHCSACQAILTQQTVTPKAEHQFEGELCKNCGSQDASEGLVFEKIDGGYKLVGLGTCTDTDVVIPSIYEGLPVLSIGAHAFREPDTGGANTTVKSIVLYEGIKTIEESGFANCHAVESIQLPESIESIGVGAFVHNESLKSIVLPDSITEIPDSLFQHCSNLKSIVVSDRLTAIGRWSFVSCGLESIDLPDTVETIEVGAFQASRLISFHAPRNLTFLGDSAFQGCFQLEEVVIDCLLTEIPMGAFEYCRALKSVTLGESIRKIGASAFLGASALETVPLPSKLTEIGNAAFRDNESLTTLCLPSTLEHIGMSAFYKCTALKELTLPASLKSGGSDIFAYSGLESVELQNGIETIFARMFIYCSDLKTVTFPSSLKAIEPDAFYSCYLLTVSWLPDSLEDVANGSFSCCTVKDFVLTKKLSEIDGLLEGARIESFTFGEGITRIADAMFSATGLTEITLPEGITEIGERAFSNCKQLNNVEFPSTLLHIGERAFSGCNAISSLSLPRSLEAIGEAAFKECDSLTEISVPNVKMKGVFSSSVRTVHFYGTTAEVKPHIYEAFNYASRATVYCTDGIAALEVFNLSKYGTNTRWILTSDGVLTLAGEGEASDISLPMEYGDLTTKFVIAEGITNLKPFYSTTQIFRFYPNIAEVDLPSTLVDIDKEVFRGTAWYESFDAGTEPIYIGNTLMMVPSSLNGSFTVADGTLKIACHAFFGCADLIEINLPDSLKEIGSGAFSGCKSLEFLTLHEGIETIGYGAISACDSLRELTIPSTVTECTGAVSNCQSLTKITWVDRPSLKISGSFASYCPSLETVVIGKGGTEFPINTLYECPNLKYVIINADITFVDRSAFWNTPRDRLFLCYGKETADAIAKWEEYADSVYLYAESEPAEEGRFWGFSEDGEIVIY